MNVATPSWYWAIPRIALLLVVLAVGALLWVLHRTEIEDQRIQLITDVLWAEQDLRFHLAKTQDLLEEVGRDASGGHVSPEHVRANIRLMMRNHPWLIQAIWYDASASIVMAIPPNIGELAVGEARGAIPSMETFGLARSLGKPVFSQPYPAVGEDYHVELHVPQFHDGKMTHMMVGVVSLKELLQGTVPWWFAQRYQLQVVDHTGLVLATKSRVDGNDGGASYTVAFDPPGRGLLLRTTAYRSSTNLLRNLLATTIIALTGCCGACGRCAATYKSAIRPKWPCGTNTLSARPWKTLFSQDCAPATCRVASPTSIRRSVASSAGPSRNWSVSRHPCPTGRQRV